MIRVPNSQSRGPMFKKPIRGSMVNLAVHLCQVNPLQPVVAFLYPLKT